MSSFHNNARQYRNNGGSGGYSQMARDSRNYKKHSGAKHTTYTPERGNNKGQKQYLTTGWRLNGRELISIRAVTTQKSKESEKGWFGSVAVTFTNTKTGENNFYWGMMEKRTGKVVVQEMSFVMNPKAKNGGYSGTFIQ